MTKELILGLSQQGQEGLLSTFSAVPDDKLGWKPLDNGRCALDLFSEAAQTSQMVADLIESRGQIKPTYETFAQMRAERENWDKATAIAAFQENGARLMEAIRGLSDEEMAQPVTLEIGGGMTIPLGGWAMMAYRTYISRFAQINYIQTLYGDFDRH